MTKEEQLKETLRASSLQALDLMMVVLQKEEYRKLVQEVIDEKVAKMGVEKGKELKL